MPRALLSVSDKTGLLEFAQELQALGFELLASGNTAKLLREHQVPVMEVADYTGSPEILDGRVKTLHPAIHGGLLARNTTDHQQQLKQHGWDYIDLVAVNLYPFEKTVAQKDVTLDQAIEQIDIGGVALIRAAAKNHERVLLVCDPQDYSRVLASLKTNTSLTELRKELAIKGFVMTSQYDSAISAYLAPNTPKQLSLYPVQQLRYGENPHQSASLYSFTPNSSPLGGQLLQGKELSYNNILDLDAAWRAAKSFADPSVVIVKHLSPCGIASAPKLADAYKLAFAADTISAFGGIIAANRTIDADTVNAFGDLFIECLVAPDFTQEALSLLSKRVNCRLLKIPLATTSPETEWRYVQGGMLAQDLDQGDPAQTEYQVVSERQPTATEWQAIKFAWQSCQHVKSNAIVLAVGTATVGIGGGQCNRLDSVRGAVERAGTQANGAVLASDAFFPFKDAVEAAVAAGITAIIQPGGSKRDADSIAAANAAGIAMVFTGVRHFRH